MSPLDLNQLIRETRKMLEHVIGKDIKIQTELEEELPFIEADLTQMQQVLMNLSVNARDAISGNGTLLIATRHVWLDERAVKNKENINTGNYVELKVSDTGSGIPEEVLPNIFDAFYSTKHAGHGTGLGLSVVKSIVLKHRGVIEVHSAPGKGAAFTIYLPILERYAEASVAEMSKESPRGNESLLIVDDEIEILHVTEKIFSDLGYRVQTAENGSKAVELYQQHRFDLVLLDIQMPGIGGRETLRLLREIDPTAKALYATGYAKPEVINAIEQANEAPIIQKPFSIQELAKAIRDALKP
jgi:CheY-like chemotaxis protein